MPESEGRTQDVGAARRPSEKHVSAGPGALSAVARLLGLEGTRGWRLEGLCWMGREGVRLSLTGGAHRLVFHLGPPSAPGAAVRTAGLSLIPQGPAGPAVRRFLRVAAARLGDRSLDDILRILEGDPRSFAATVEPGLSGDRIAVPCVGQNIWLMEDGWRNFFADQDFEILLGVPACVPNQAVNIEYTDIECHYARPKRSFRKWTFLDWPDEAFDEAPGGSGVPSITIELEERDMILGTGERADALVEEAKKLAAAGHYLVFTHLCTPIIMGEDFQGLARRCEKEIGGKAVRWSQKDRDEKDNFGEHLRSLLGRPGFFDPPGDPMAVNLFHFPRRCREEELRPLLEGLGLRINVCAFPDVDFPRLEDIPRAVWQILCQRSSYPSTFRELLAASPRPVLTVRAPYGIEGTRECLRAIAAAAGKEAEFESAWAGRLEAFRPAWEEMKREASGYRLAFVVSRATLPRLLELRYGYGAPLAEMVKEMGFGIDLLVYDLHGEAPELPPGLRGARVTTFRTPWELEQALRRGEFQAVFSDICFDWRINRAGKARFSSRDFEMGIEGALRTFPRLLAACRLPFYRRYASHLARVRRKHA